MFSFEVFRTGTHTAANGREYTFTDADLETIADGFNPSLRPSPVVVGHPVNDAPAYGWVQRLGTAKGRLVAFADALDEGFRALVRDGRYKNVSASFFLPGQAGNPTPGRYYLKHVGFLGAQQPAVKGLRPAMFAEVDEALSFAEPARGTAEAAGALIDSERAAGRHLTATEAVAIVSRGAVLCFAGMPIDFADPLAVGKAAGALIDSERAAGRHLTATEAVARVRAAI